ncbi:MAG TPA: hypothetical protein VGB92_23175, partial [Longimicrobium sp.]
EARAHQDRLDAHPVLAAAFGQRRAKADAHAAAHVLAWTAVVRRALARADTPEEVELPPPPENAKPRIGSAGVENAIEAVLRGEAALGVSSQAFEPAPTVRPTRLRPTVVLACSVAVVAALSALMLRREARDYELTISCADRTRIEALALQFQHYDALVKFEDTESAGRMWTMVMPPLPESEAERIAYQAREWRAVAPGDCYASAIWNP